MMGRPWAIRKLLTINVRDVIISMSRDDKQIKLTRGADTMYKDDFEACLGIENFTVSLTIEDVLNIHAYVMEWAEAIHLGNKMESAYYRGRLYGIVEGLEMAHQLKSGYTHKRVFDHFEKFATDWGHDEAYWLQDMYDSLKETYDYMVKSNAERGCVADEIRAISVNNALNYIKSKLYECENRKEN